MPESPSPIRRRSSRPVKVGKIVIGGDAPISIQSMTNTFTHDVDATLRQVRRLEEAGCEIIRVSVPDQRSLSCLERIKKGMTVPLVADIHFSHTLALGAVDAGADKVRINPGNIGGEERLREVALKCKAHGVAMRVGVNSGSLERDILRKHGHPTPEAIVESALRHVRFLESLGCDQLVLSVKSSDVAVMVQAYRLLAARCDYPFHVGVTEAGAGMQGAVKSAAGIGAVLLDGIGDTIRVSLTGDPVGEIPVAKSLLRSLGLRREGAEIVACPTCARTQVDLETMVERVEKALRNLKTPLKVAVMGCIVNGLGEGAEADIGICAEKGRGVLIEKGRETGRYPEIELVPALLKRVQELTGEKL